MLLKYPSSYLSFLWVRYFPQHLAIFIIAPIIINHGLFLFVSLRNVSLNNSTFPQIIYLINILEIDIHMSTSSDPGNSHNNVKKVL